MQVTVANRCSDYSSYRAARVKSLFNAENGCNFDLVADIPLDEPGWKLGVIVGPSGSGKTSIGTKVWGGSAIYQPEGWPADAPIIDGIAPGGDFNEVTGALAAVGLGSVPAWLRPYHALSNGEKFRADLARIVSEKPAQVIVDEFTSVVDRQIAKIGALAFQKAWRRTGGQCILLSCHYDILEWLEPDWVFDTATGRLGRDRLQRPKFDLQVWETDSRYWHLFEPHHYLKLPKMVAATYYVGTVDGELVCHVATSPRFEIDHMRACRLVVMPEWQGAGAGLRFLDNVCQRQLEGGNKWGRKVKGVLFHTSHPGLVSALKRSPKWRQTSAVLYGGNKRKSAKTIRASQTCVADSGYGGHFRAVQGFTFKGAPA